jgi:hypothetical protein
VSATSDVRAALPRLFLSQLGIASESGRSADGGIPDWHSEDSFVRVRVDGFLSASARSAEGDE